MSVHLGSHFSTMGLILDSDTEIFHPGLFLLILHPAYSCICCGSSVYHPTDRCCILGLLDSPFGGLGLPPQSVCKRQSIIQSVNFDSFPDSFRSCSWPNKCPDLSVPRSSIIAPIIAFLFSRCRGVRSIRVWIVAVG